ncbi:MAG: 4'-phosphopantetheinyl transferase superfamily protein [Burkholderiales bacterium]|jgi:phosphopantetheinyl transferase|nr:4'-phosphopantetheinyl transferase superfamily protein [Burkholderiales bacterium]
MWGHPLVLSIKRLATTLFFARIDSIENHQESLAQTWLNPSDWAHYKTLKRNVRAQQFLLGRILLKRAIALTLCRDDHQIMVSRAPNGMPLASLWDHAPLGVGYSLSHSRAWVACAVSSSYLLGLDIEYIDLKRDSSVLQQFLYTDEKPASYPKNLQDLYRAWTIKEAFYKLSSVFLSMPDRCSLEVSALQRQCLTHTLRAPDPMFMVSLCAGGSAKSSTFCR